MPHTIPTDSATAPAPRPSGPCWNDDRSIDPCDHAQIGPSRWVAFGLGVWGLLVLGGLFILWHYEHAPGRLEPPPDRWPRASQLSREPGRMTLLLFVHPRCPCSRSSLRELERILTLNREHVEASAVFLKPATMERGWERTDVWDFADQVPGVHVHSDTDGREAALFHAYTSGTAVAYDAQGRLAFYGGITVSRGHEGPSAGGDALGDLVRGERPRYCSNEVFGCPLFDERTDSPGGELR